MSDEFEVRHFDNRVQPGSDLSVSHQQKVPDNDESVEIGRVEDGDYNPASQQNTPSKRMATYHHDSPGGEGPPGPPQYDRQQYGAEGGDEYEVQVISQQRQPPPRRTGPKPANEEHALDDFEQGTEGDCGCCGLVLYALSVIVIVLTFPLTIFFCIKIVQEYERAVIFRLGRVLPEAKGPGMFFIVPCLEDFKKVDLRTLSFDVPPQEILTKDSVTVTVDAVVYWRIDKPLTSVVRVSNAYYSTLLLAQTTLRNILGTKELREVLSQRDEIVASMQAILDEGTDPWGVQVERVEIKDVRLPTMLQRAMAKEAESQREAHAKVIAAEGEKMASRGLAEAAHIMSENSSALQLRYLQTLSNIAAERESTIIFPLPIEGLAMSKKQK